MSKTATKRTKPDVGGVYAFSPAQRKLLKSMAGRGKVYGNPKRAL